VEYRSDESGRLQLRHLNAGFNCCPGKLGAEVNVSGRLITVTETEEQAGCRCLCLFDLEIEVTDLEQGEYALVLVEPYAASRGPALVSTVSLGSSGEGRFCVERHGYPWAD
jgi:hypothetical protein